MQFLPHCTIIDIHTTTFSSQSPQEIHLMKDIIKIITFTAIVLIILAALSAIFNGRFWYTNGYVANRDARYAAFGLEEPGRIDVLNVGSSLCDVSLSPPELYRDYGITSYNMGRDMQNRSATYYALLTALRSQKIKVLLWETDNLCKQDDEIRVRRSDGYRYKDYMLPYRQELAEFYYYHFPVLRYHSSWINWVSGIKHDQFYKGFQIKKEIVKPEPEEDSAKEGPGDDSAKESPEDKKPLTRAEKLRAKIALKDKLKFRMDQMYAFRRIYNLCKANDIKLVLYSAPSMKYYPTRRRHDAVAELAQKYGIDYIDGNFDEDLIGIDWDKDSCDGGKHLNLYGSRKMTRYLGEYLRKHCDLEDHRGDPAYAEWADMEKYEEECGE